MRNQAAKEEATEKLGKWLAAGQTTFVAFAAAIGVTSGAITRIFRNSAGEAVLWLAFITFGILMGVVVSNGSASGVTMRAGQLLLAGFGAAIAGLAALWAVLGLDASQPLAQDGGGALQLSVTVIEFVGGLPDWLFLVAFLLLMGTWITARLPVRLPESHRSWILSFFTSSWSGLYWLGATALMFVVLQTEPAGRQGEPVEPDPRAVAASLGVLFITGAITWAVDTTPIQANAAPTEDPEQATTDSSWEDQP